MKTPRGRFRAGLDPRAQAFSSSLAIDRELAEEDIAGSLAHAEMLAETGLITDADCAAIRDGLTALAASHHAGEWSIGLEDEDVHTALESRLTQAVGEAGGRLHLGRSRNDQVLAALRLYLTDAADDLCRRTAGLRRAIAALADRQGEVALPGYTHMQHAMPSSVALWCGGFDAAFADAIEGLRATRRRMSTNPLGSAAGYGTPGLPIDRDCTTAKLGFDTTQTPVTAVQLSRGKAESALLFEITLLFQDLGRLATDLLLFYTQEFGYVTLAPELTTGSSIMPQKRNPDVLELIRAASATAQASLDEALMITAKLPSGYQRDLQRLKAPLFRAIDLAIDSVDIMAYLLDGLRFNADNIELDAGIHAAEEANRLVRDEGIPFRVAYQRVAERYSK